MNDDIDYLVNRFLCWQLPEDFAPDNYISYNPPQGGVITPPVGTNLLTFRQAQEMVCWMLEGWYGKDKSETFTVWVVEAPGPNYMSARSSSYKEFGWTRNITEALSFSTETSAVDFLKTVRVKLPDLFIFTHLLGHPVITSHQQKIISHKDNGKNTA